MRAAVPAASRIHVLDGATWIATELARETFADAGWKERWSIEGTPAVSVRDGKLMVVTADPPAGASATLWWREPLPDNMLVELTAGSDFPAERNAANLNLIFHARELDGSPYVVGRTGRYEDYHTIPNYIITLTGGFQEGWSRVRRDPGFELLSEEKSTRADIGRTYRIRALIAGGRIRYWIDDKSIHDARDPQPHTGGHFALRTWRSRIWWSDISFSTLKRAEGTGALPPR